MNRASKIGILVATHLVAVSVGVFVGVWYVGRTLRQVDVMMNHMMLTTRYASHAEFQRVEGSDEAYREALLVFLAALDQVRNPDDPLYNEKSNMLDKMLIYIRLARLERKVGNSAGFENYMKHAVNTCEALGSKNCQPDHLVTISETLEKKSPFGESGETDK